MQPRRSFASRPERAYRNSECAVRPTATPPDTASRRSEIEHPVPKSNTQAGPCGEAASLFMLKHLGKLRALL